MKKRVLSMFMALALCLTLLPAPAWAAEADAPEGGAAQVTTAGGTGQVYGSFNDAWSAAIKSEGSTLKLLSDVELSKEVGEDGLPVSEGSFTLDLNNKTLKGAIWNQLLEVSGTGEYHHQKRQSGQHTDWARSECNIDKFCRSENFRRNRCS